MSLEQLRENNKRMGVAACLMLPEDKHAKILGVNNRVFYAVALTTLSVCIECFLNWCGVLTWEYSWWSRSCPWLIWLIGYLPFFTMAFVVHDMEKMKNKLLTLGIIFGVNIACLIVFGAMGDKISPCRAVAVNVVMQTPKSPKKPLAWYYIFVILLLLILNATLFPSLVQSSVKEVDYSTFQQMLSDKQVKEVEVQDNQIVFSDTADPVKYYKTGLMSDPDLVKELAASGASYGTQIVQQQSAITTFLLYWVLPTLVFIALGEFLVKKMAAGTGGFGNAMCSWYSWLRQVAILPLPGPGAVTTTRRRSVSM